MTPAAVARRAAVRVLGPDTPLAHPSFRRLVLAHGANVLGYWIYFTAVFTRVSEELGGGSTQTSRITAAASLPLIVFAPFTGLFIDRYGPKRALIAAYAAASAILGAASFSHSFAGFYLAALCLAFAMALLRPAVFGILSRTVPARQLAQGNGTLFAAGEAGIVVGPLLADVVIDLAGTTAAFLLAAVTLLSAAVALRTLPAPPALVREIGASWRARLYEVGAGVRTLATDSSSRIAMVCVIGLFGFIGAIISLEPVLLADELDAGDNLGLLYATGGLGSCVSSLVLSRRAYPRRPLPRIATALGLVGLATIGYSTASSLPVAMAWNLVVGLSFGWVLAPAVTVVQQRTPAFVIGRVMAAFAICQQAAQGVAALLVGQLAEGRVRTGMATTGVVLAVAGGLILLRTRRRTEPPPPPGSPLAGAPAVGIAVPATEGAAP